jgi:hypothetical protein
LHVASLITASYDPARHKIELEHLHFVLSMAFIEVNSSHRLIKRAFCCLLRACRFNGNFGGQARPQTSAAMQAAEMQLERVVCHAENSGSVVPFPRFVPAAKSSAFQEIMRPMSSLCARPTDWL